MKNKKRIITLGAAAVTTIAVLGGTFAYFTGYDSKDLTAKAGTLTVELTDATEDLTNGLTVINPGDANPLTFTVSNTGEKSMDVKAVMNSREQMEHHLKLQLEDAMAEEKEVYEKLLD